MSLISSLGLGHPGCHGGGHLALVADRATDPCQCAHEVVPAALSPQKSLLPTEAPGMIQPHAGVCRDAPHPRPEVLRQRLDLSLSLGLTEAAPRPLLGT